MERFTKFNILFCGGLISGLMCVPTALRGQDSARNNSTVVTPPAAEQAATIHAASEEVLLDLVARDKHGRAVRDLTRDQIEVYEDGVKQQITSFRIVEGQESILAVTTPSGRHASQPDVLLGQVNLVSLVFERLGEDGRKHAREAALAFLRSELRPNVYVAVLTNDKQLYVLQQFTNDRQKLEQAVDTATRASSSQMASMSAGIVRELEMASGALGAANIVASGSLGGERPTGGSIGPAMAEAKMAQMMVDMIQQAALFSRQEEGRSSLYSLLSLVKEQRRLPGRKTIIYLCQGLNVTPGLTDLFRTTVSEANRSNVSVYSVDARGLVASEVSSGAAREIMMGAESPTRAQAWPGRGDEESGARKIGGESAFEANARANVQDNLADLSRSTGGFLIANTNEMDLAMKRISEDIRSYYALAYRPSTHEYDNKFHKISVKVLRSGVILQTRNGYLATLPVAGSPVFAYEAPMLAALKSATAKEVLHYHAQTLHFKHTREGMQCHLVMEVPLSNFTFRNETSKNNVRAHFSVMALVLGENGENLFKFSENYPLEGPSEKVELLKKGSIIFARDFRLPTGRYTLETIALDQETQKASVQRSVLVVPPPPTGLALSSLSIIQRLDPIPPSEHGNADPLQLDNSEIIPNLGEPIHQGISAGVPLYFVIYPSAQSAEKPQGQLELSRGGTIIASGPVSLPNPDSRGAIRYVGTIPAAKLSPGRYSIRALIRQGPTAAEEYAFFTVAP